MLDKGKHNVLGVLIDAVDYDTAATRILDAARAHRGLAVSALAVHGVMTGALDATQCYRLNHLDLALPDGQPVRWALNWLHNTELAERVCGPTLMLKVCERAAEAGLPIYLYGSHTAVLDALCANLRRRFPGLLIAGASPSRFRQVSGEEKEEIAEAIRRSGAAITFVGLGCPRQETWVYEYRDVLSMPLIAIGAAFDFHAGTLRQAPTRLQDMGLEWLYRLMLEPGRLWKRYLLLNPLYLAMLALQASGLKRFDPASARPPEQELRYG